MVATIPELKARKSLSIPSLKITPFSGISDKIFIGIFAFVIPNTSEALVATLGNGSRYFALMSSDDITPRPGGNASDSRWSSLRGEGVRDALAFDHADILRAALARLRSKVEYTSLPAFLLPGEFTLTQLQKIYEVILGRALEKKAFRTRLLAADILEALPRKLSGPNRPAQLYRLKRRLQAHIFSRPFGSADDTG